MKDQILDLQCDNFKKLGTIQFLHGAPYQFSSVIHKKCTAEYLKKATKFAETTSPSRRIVGSEKPVVKELQNLSEWWS